ncbi:MAG TPA: transposase [Jatrophihabitans sp.]|nr:transposase [Jatrophihabitans sp.]
MRTAVVSIADQRTAAVAAGSAGSSDAVLAELSSQLFGSLPRSDQRRNGSQYLEGLLSVEGRKSIRNIASAFGIQANEQSLHHFINSSTWDWRSVRQALCRYLLRTAPPQAWVLSPMITPMTGQQTVGVQRRFVPAMGQLVNVQHAIGVWAGSERMCSPISWRLHLPEEWLADPARRRKASIPDDIAAESLEACMVRAMLELAGWQLPVRPVVFDARALDAAQVVLPLAAARRPLLARVDDDVPLLSVESLTRGGTARPLRASQILSGVQNMRRLVAWSDDGTPEAKRASLFTAVRVRMLTSRPQSGGGEGRVAAGGELMLLGVGQPGRQWPAQCWLTNLSGAAPGALLQLGRMVDRVAWSATAIGDEVGIRDFRGRSFGGWHRHVTLASAAHAVTALAQRTPDRASNVS